MTTNIISQNFRSALGGFATGICVLGAKREDGALFGMTVNSFTSVSLEPPLILVCLGTYTPRTQEIIKAEHFSISILNEQQRNISQHFAKPGEGLVMDQGWSTGANGAPLIDQALASLECDIESTHMAGDHQIVIGQVTKIVSQPEQNPLLYFQGKYRTLGNEIE